jgi:type IV pilus assembly protein PilE
MARDHEVRFRCAGPRRAGARGVTLLELLLVVVVIGILAMVAVPSYTQYLVRGQRSAAKGALLQAADMLERSYTANGCYNYTNATDCQRQSGTALSLGAFGYSPTDGSTKTYAITPTLNNQSFSLTATPCGSGGSCPAPSNTNFTDADCGALTLTNTGDKASTGALTAVQCWNR